MSVTIHTGDCRNVLQSIPESSVHCCVTSPPYWGLRDYGHDRQIGLEQSPDDYVKRLVEVFARVWRVLRSDGTLWLNLGDSYVASGWGGGIGEKSTIQGTQHDGDRDVRKVRLPSFRRDKADAGGVKHKGAEGLRPKNLVGIPWRVALALQAPRYNGNIERALDRVWLAAMLDAEGCLFIHKRKAGQGNGQGYERQSDTYSPGVEISNTHSAIVERIAALVGKGSICQQEGGKFGRRQTLYRWNLRTTESREFVREMYPYLVAKQHQARILCGCASSGVGAEAAHEALKLLHQGGTTTVDFDPPSSMFCPGWYLRSDIIWSKPNPMPESVTDRPTKSHEYLFLLSKSERYYYDAEAIKEPRTSENRQPLLARPDKALGPQDRNGHSQWETGLLDVTENRNKRTVWTVPSSPYADAHFATYPPDLIKPCILAGCPAGGTVLDPFGGSGTTGMVASELGRNAILIELNPEYVKLAEQRCNVTPGLHL